MKVLKTLAALTLLLAVAPSFALGDIAGMVVHNTSEHAIWVTFYASQGRSGNMARGCVLPGKNESFHFGKWVSKYSVLGEVKASKTTCAEHSNFKIVETNELTKSGVLTFFQSGKAPNETVNLTY